MVALFQEKEQCCGCAACADTCPDAIEMRVDSEGFSYPYTNPKGCAECRGCRAVCPFVSKIDALSPVKYLAAQALDPKLREISTSGAVFPILASRVLESGGVVYGAAFDTSMQVVHQRAETSSQLRGLMQTKYVQSRTDGIYRAVQRDLDQGKRVLFTGTPCQAAALRLFVGDGAQNLVIVDTVCFGVPSPGVWEQYKAFLERELHGQLSEYNFRDKSKKNNGHAISFTLGSLKHTKNDYASDLFLSLYFSGYILRPSCHVCPFTTPDRSSDITIGDFWGIEKAAPQMDDGMGTSLVLLRTEPGIELWQSVADQFRVVECNREDVLQPRLVSPTPPARWRRLFFQLLRILPLSSFDWKNRLRRRLNGKS